MRPRICIVGYAPVIAFAKDVARTFQAAADFVFVTSLLEGALPQLVHDQLLDLVGPDEKLVQRRRLIDIGKMESNAVVRPDGVRLNSERIA